MARALRVEYPGALQYVINLGNAGDDICKSLRIHLNPIQAKKDTELRSYLWRRIVAAEIYIT